MTSTEVGRRRAWRTRSTAPRLTWLALASLATMACTGCYSYPLVGGGVKSAVTKEETQVAPFWGTQGAALDECRAGIHSVTVDEPWYGNILRLVTLGILGVHRVQVICNEALDKS
jgi:hypothetical protein